MYYGKCSKFDTKKTHKVSPKINDSIDATPYVVGSANVDAEL